MLITEIPWLVTMGLLLLASAFFSSSEAAWFYLGRKDRQLLAGGNRAQRVAVGLLEDSDRLLSAVLFWNLVINLAYFTISSILALRLERDGHPTRAGLFTVGSLFAIIVFSEMLPKNLAVLKPRLLVSWFAIPLATMVRLLDGVQWIFQMVGRVSLRVIWPTFTPEPDLRVDDLERAVDLSVDDDALLDQEDEVLRAIVLLSDIRADELMRPRIACRTFRPPVSLPDLKGKVPPSGYLLVTESESDEIASAIELDALSTIPVEHLEHHATPVVYVPWCIPVSAVLEQMRRRDRRVAVVVNELGETIGVLTFEAILDQIFLFRPEVQSELSGRPMIEEVAQGVWHLTGRTTLRFLTRSFGRKRPPSKSVTVAGVVQEVLGRLPEVGDLCHWGAYEFKVIEIPERGELVLEMRLIDEEDQE